MAANLPEKIDPALLTRTVFYRDDIEARLCYYTPDAMSQKAVKEMEQYMEDHPEESFSDYEDQHGLRPHDYYDKKNRHFPAQELITEDGHKTCSHYERGEPFNLYGMAQEYEKNEEGEILASLHWVDHEIVFNNEIEHAAFVHCCKFHENKKKLGMEVSNQNNCYEELSINMIQRMGLN